MRREVYEKEGRKNELTSSIRFCLTRPGYIDEVSLALKFVRESSEATLEEKKKFFKSANKVGLMLSYSLAKKDASS